MNVGDRLEHYKRGLALFGEGRHDDAIAEYERALELSPEWTDAMHGLAIAHMNAGRLDEAIRVGKRIVELDPEDPFAHTSLSMFYQRKGMIDEAEAEGARARMVAWKRELKQNPDAPPPDVPGGIDVTQ